jgi:hypothetical protein
MAMMDQCFDTQRPVIDAEDFVDQLRLIPFGSTVKPWTCRPNGEDDPRLCHCQANHLDSIHGIRDFCDLTRTRSLSQNGLG